MCSNTDIDCKKYIIRVFKLHAYFLLGHEQSSFSNLSVTSPTSQLILQPFRRFSYVTTHSLTIPLLHLRHNSFSNPSVASPTSQLVPQPFFRFSYVTSSSLNSPDEPPMYAQSRIYLNYRPSRLTIIIHIRSLIILAYTA